MLVVKTRTSPDRGLLSAFAEMDVKGGKRRVACIHTISGLCLVERCDALHPIHIADGLEQTDCRRKHSVTGPFCRRTGPMRRKSRNLLPGENADPLPKSDDCLELCSDWISAKGGAIGLLKKVWGKIDHFRQFAVPMANQLFLSVFVSDCRQRSLAG